GVDEPPLFRPPVLQRPRAGGIPERRELPRGIVGYVFLDLQVAGDVLDDEDDALRCRHSDLRSRLDGAPRDPYRRGPTSPRGRPRLPARVERARLHSIDPLHLAEQVGKDITGDRESLEVEPKAPTAPWEPAEP